MSKPIRLIAFLVDVRRASGCGRRAAFQRRPRLRLRPPHQ